MFNNTKFKKGDKVLTLSDLTYSFIVKKVFIEEHPKFVGMTVEKVILDNDVVVNADSLTFYSEALVHLERKNKQLLKELNDIKSTSGSVIKELKNSIEKTNKELKELKDKVIKQKNSYDYFSSYASSMAMLLGGGCIKEVKEEENKTLEERIEELEAKLTKKVKITKVKKNKSKKSKK